MPNIEIGTTVNYGTTWPQLAINGVGVDPSYISVSRLEVYSDGVPNTLYLKIHKPFDDLSWFTWGNTVTLDAGGKRIFIGPLLNNQPEISGYGDHQLIAIPDLTWHVNRNYVEYDAIGRPAAEMMEIIVDGVPSTSNSKKNPWIDSKVNNGILRLGNDGATLGKTLQNYAFEGMPAFDALCSVIRQAGNHLIWVTYKGDVGYLNFIKRHTGPARSLTIGNSGTNDTTANVVSITGTRSALNIANSFVARGDRMIYEVTEHTDEGDAIVFKHDWPSGSEAAVLSNPGAGFIETLGGATARAVGRQYVLEESSISSASVLANLSQFVHSSGKLQNTSNCGRDDSIQLFYNEPLNGSGWELYKGKWKLVRKPPKYNIMGGEHINKGGNLYLVFDSPQCYKDTSASETTFAGFRDYKLTFAYRKTADDESKNRGRISAESGKKGKFQWEVKRLIHAPNYKYIQRRNSYRYELYSSGGGSGYVYRTLSVQDDRAKLMELVKNFADANSEPTESFRIVVKGNTCPDISWSPGQRIINIVNSDAYSNDGAPVFGGPQKGNAIDWDIVGVIYDFETAETILLTEDLQAAMGVEAIMSRTAGAVNRRSLFRLQPERKI